MNVAKQMLERGVCMTYRQAEAEERELYGLPSTVKGRQELYEDQKQQLELSEIQEPLECP